MGEVLDSASEARNGMSPNAPSSPDPPSGPETDADGDADGGPGHLLPPRKCSMGFMQYRGMVQLFQSLEQGEGAVQPVYSYRIGHEQLVFAVSFLRDHLQPLPECVREVFLGSELLGTLQVLDLAGATQKALAAQYRAVGEVGAIGQSAFRELVSMLTTQGPLQFHQGPGLAEKGKGKGRDRTTAFLAALPIVPPLHAVPGSDGPAAAAA